ncbi:MAG: hypothetical protein KGZ58_07370 [Ignavibacteriales bacterium]|nr:hypothetical protein [Ignavibacteriales bacterium]
MKTLSFKIEDSIYNETEKVLTRLKKTKERYINEALDHYNKTQRRKLLAKQLVMESKLVGNESLAVLKEFESFDDN